MKKTLREEELLATLRDFKDFQKSQAKKAELGDPDGDMANQGKFLTNPAKAPLSKDMTASEPESTTSDDESSDDGSKPEETTDKALIAAGDTSGPHTKTNKAAIAVPGAAKKGETKKSEPFADLFKSNEEIRKAANVSPFFESIVDQTTEGLDALRKSILDVEASVGSFQSNQSGFNSKLAKGFTQLGNLVLGLSEGLQRIEAKINNQPIEVVRKSYLSESEYQRTPQEQLQGPDPRQMAALIFQKACNNEIPGHYVTLFEQQGTIQGFPDNIQKALLNDLQKAS